MTKEERRIIRDMEQVRLPPAVERELLAVCDAPRGQAERTLDQLRATPVPVGR
jgi:hypothetical protein